MTKEELRQMRIDAMVETAYAYHRRKDAIQYETRDFSHIHRWKGGPVRRTNGFAPEEATLDNQCFTVCSAFFYNIMKDVFNYKWCNDDANHECAVIKECYKEQTVYSWTRDNGVTCTKALRDIVDMAQPGDLFVYDHCNFTKRHIMLVLPDEKLMHSNGANFNAPEGKERYETQGTVRLTTFNDFFLHVFGEYPVWHYDEIKLIRIVDAIDPEKYPLTPQALSRLKYKGLDIDRCCNRRAYQAVKPGEEITYTIRLHNTNPWWKPYKRTRMDFEDIVVEEYVPEGTELLISSLSNDVAVNGNKLSWKVNLGVEQTVVLQYTVRVKDDVSAGTYIVSGGGRVDDIPSNTIKTLVGGAISAEDWKKLQSLAEDGALKDAKIQGDGIAQWVYETVLGKSVTIPTAMELLKAQYETWIWNKEVSDENGETKILPCTVLKEKENRTEAEKALCAHIVPKMIGGLALSCVFYDDRITEFRGEHLQAGDVVAVVNDLTENGCTTEQYLCLGGGKCVRSTPDGFEVMDLPYMNEVGIPSSYFAVLRPALWEK